MSKARDLANAGTALTTVSATELGYLDGVTSAVQTQLNAKQATVSGVNDTEIGYLDGVTSAIQTQIDAQIPKSIVDVKGDIIAATAADTVSKLSVGANDTVLTADSSTATGLKWATPAAGGGLTLLSTTNLSGANTSISGISGSYKNLVIWIRGAYANGAAQMDIAPDGNSPCLAVKMSDSTVANLTAIRTPANVGTSASNLSQNSYFRLENYANSTYGKTFQWYGVYSNSGNASFMITGVWNYATSVNYIEFYVSGAGVTWSGGQVLIYGEN